MVTNTPDPFNPTTTIEYNLPAASIVDVSIYNVRGRLVRTLERGPRASGRNRLTWDGLTATGTATPSGVYFVVVRTPVSMARDRLTLVR